MGNHHLFPFYAELSTGGANDDSEVQAEIAAEWDCPEVKYKR